MKCRRKHNLNLDYIRATELIKIQKRRKCFCMRMSDDRIGITADCSTVKVDREINGFQMNRTGLRNFAKKKNCYYRLPDAPTDVRDDVPHNIDLWLSKCSLVTPRFPRGLARKSTCFFLCLPIIHYKKTVLK